ncbi:porin [Bosea sp. RAF48]|uniref:porin n=1 Tax=Bosea sp. RAF48 TaxID=3237480 RepID=UPI003F931143
MKQGAASKPARRASLAREIARAAGREGVVLAVGAAASIGLLDLVGEARAAGRPPTLLRSCTIATPDLEPLLPEPPSISPGKAGADDTGDDDEEDEADDDDEEDPPPSGFVSPGLGGCIVVSGTVNAGLQGDNYRANALARATGLVPQNTTSFPLSTTFRIESGQSLANGHYLATAFEFSMDTNSGGGTDVTIGEASITLGAFSAGLASSRFDFWTGDEFALVGRIPSRTVALIGYERPLTEELSLSLSAEDVSADQRIPLPTAGRRLPDGVARLVYEGEALTLHGAVALREVSRIGAPSLSGRAAIIGATWEGSVLDRSFTLSGQIAGAVDAPAYVGSLLDRRTALPFLTGDQTTRGWSGLVSIGWDWSDEWSSNAYLSRYSLTLPRAGDIGGQVRIDRMSANLIWRPVTGLRLGLEGSLAWQRLDIVGSARAAALSGTQSTAQIFIERVF